MLFVGDRCYIVSNCSYDQIIVIHVERISRYALVALISSDAPTSKFTANLVREDGIVLLI